MSMRRPPADDEELRVQIVDTIERLKLLVDRLEQTINKKDEADD